MEIILGHILEMEKSLCPVCDSILNLGISNEINLCAYKPFLGAGLQYWRRLVETQARSEVDVVGGELLPWHNLRKIKVEERLGKEAGI